MPGWCLRFSARRTGGVASAHSSGGTTSYPLGWDLPDFARNAGTAIRVDLTHFEDDLSRQYRQIVGLLLAEAFYSKSDIELGEETRRAFYRYFDLSNEQLFLARQNHRVSDAVIEQWKDGIAGNMKLPAFKLAWREIGARKA